MINNGEFDDDDDDDDGEDDDESEVDIGGDSLNQFGDDETIQVILGFIRSLFIEI